MSASGAALPSATVYQNYCPEQLTRRPTGKHDPKPHVKVAVNACFCANNGRRRTINVVPVTATMALVVEMLPISDPDYELPTITMVSLRSGSMLRML
ncbi:hypothetical protein AMTR_s00068p00198690 [Amborella trichopoda]|uniref:Uncharacterized protein n=1 Tax=Amborella trichopoda TaxID=13333 RepID=U5DIY2_AMBTC|nr:hypothetical protein AMTR_s00068p00198690 [Amborella trichopoda]